MIHETRMQEPPRAAMAPDIVETTIEYRPFLPRMVSWGAVLGGVVTAVAVQIVLTVLGMAIGLSIIAPSGDQADPQAFGIGAGIWWLVTGLISLFLGGWVAGRVAGYPQYFESAMQGFLTWCTVTFISALLVTSAGGALLSGAMSVMANSLQSGGEDLAESTRGLFGDDDVRGGSSANYQIGNRSGRQHDEIRRQVDDLVRESGGSQRDTDEVMMEIEYVIIGQAHTPADRQAAVDTLVAHTSLSRAEAQQLLARWQNQAAGEGEFDTREAQRDRSQSRSGSHQTGAGDDADLQKQAERVAGAAAGGSWWTLLALVLGATVATIGGTLGPAAFRPDNEGRHRRS